MYKIYIDKKLFCDSRLEELAILDPQIDLEVNKAGTFTFTIPPEHPYYDDIERRLTLIEVYRDEDTEPLFEGVAVSITDDFYLQRKVECEGALSFFNDTIQRPARYQDVTARGLLETFINIHNSLCEEAKHFEVGMVTVHDPNDSIYCYTNYESTMQCITDDLLNDLGGYLRIRHENGKRYLDYLKDSPRTNTQIISLGENLIDFESTLDTSKIATVVIPLGATLEEEERTPAAIDGLDERLTIASVNDGKIYLESTEAIKNFGRVEQIVSWDSVKTASQLKSKGEKYLTDSQFDNLVIQANAVDLHIVDSDVESIKLLDNVRVLSKPHGLNRYFMITKLSYHLNNPDQDRVTLGSEEIKSLSNSTRGANDEILKKIEQVPTSTMVASAVNNATQIITGNEGGYVKIIQDKDGKPSEIMIMDTEDEETALKVWRWNKSGLGYGHRDKISDDLVYGLAMTIDGAIVADYITSGTLSANRIYGGILTLGGKDNVNGSAEIKNASGTIVGKLNNVGLSLGTDSGYRIDIQNDAMINAYKYGSNIGGINFFGDFTYIIDGYYKKFNMVDIKGPLIRLSGEMIDFNADRMQVKITEGSFVAGGTGALTVITNVTSDYTTNVVKDISFTRDTDGALDGASWTNLSFGYLNGAYSSSYVFQKGLLVSSLNPIPYGG